MTAPLSGHHVAVLLGGLSSEREVSLVSGRECADALERLGAKVSRVDAGRDLAQVLARLKPDVCFNALHGAWGEDGCVQGVLETLGLPYTHCGVLASALAMDKARSKAVLAAAGVVVPGGGLFNRFDVAAAHVMAPPYVVKPNAEGSSVGVFLVFEGANGPPQEVIAPSWTFGEAVMVEPYIRGLELAVGVMDGKAMTVTEIIPATGFYDYDAKLLIMRLGGRLGGPGVGIAKRDALVGVGHDGLRPRPAWRHIGEQAPGKIVQLLSLAVA